MQHSLECFFSSTTWNQKLPYHRRRFPMLWLGWIHCRLIDPWFRASFKIFHFFRKIMCATRRIVGPRTGWIAQRYRYSLRSQGFMWPHRRSRKNNVIIIYDRMRWNSNNKSSPSVYFKKKSNNSIRNPLTPSYENGNRLICFVDAGASSLHFIYIHALFFVSLADVSLFKYSLTVFFPFDFIFPMNACKNLMFGQLIVWYHHDLNRFWIFSECEFIPRSTTTTEKRNRISTGWIKTELSIETVINIQLMQNKSKLWRIFQHSWETTTTYIYIYIYLYIWMFENNNES